LILTTFLFLYNIIPHNFQIRDLIGKIIGLYLKLFFSYPNFFFRNLGAYIIKILDILNNGVNSIMSNLLNIEPLKLIDKQFDSISKFTLLTYENNKLLDHRYLFAALYSGLLLEEEVKKEGKKVMIVSIANEDKTFYIHKNIIIDENTTINDYLEKINKSIQSFYEAGYPLTAFNILQVKI